ncbi:unannotated protein [freshwater metagenome]|uniref:Unannotated protein n=1 Tax=freshwater metagenome TaxID=449393 RepID=A0A6J6Z4U0_9ZZZZ
MHLDDGVPLEFGHREQHAVAQDASVVDDDIEATETVDRLLHHRLSALEAADVAGVGDGFTSSSDDLVGDVLRGASVAAHTIAAGAEIVDDHLGAMMRQEEGVFAANATACAGDDAHTAFTHTVLSHEV